MVVFGVEALYCDRAAPIYGEYADSLELTPLSIYRPFPDKLRSLGKGGADYRRGESGQRTPYSSAR